MAAAKDATDSSVAPGATAETVPAPPSRSEGATNIMAGFSAHLTRYSRSATVSVAWDPTQTFKEMIGSGFSKTHLPLSSMVVNGVLGGLFLSYGVNVMVSILDECPAKGPCKYLGGVAFSGGLFFICCLGAELFTGNCLIFLAVLAGRVRWYEMVKDWLVIWVSNLLGAVLAEAVLFAGGNSGSPGDLSVVGTGYCAVAGGKAGLPPQQIFFRGISANILVCVAILIASAAKSIEGKFFGIAVPISIFICSGFEHSIANMCIFTMATLLGCEGPHGAYWLNLVLATLGNTCGACLLSTAAWISIIRPSELKSRAAANPEDSEGRAQLPVLP